MLARGREVTSSNSGGGSYSSAEVSLGVGGGCWCGGAVKSPHRDQLRAHTSDGAAEEAGRPRVQPRHPPPLPREVRGPQEPAGHTHTSQFRLNLAPRLGGAARSPRQPPDLVLGRSHVPQALQTSRRPPRRVGCTGGRAGWRTRQLVSPRGSGGSPA